MNYWPTRVSISNCNIAGLISNVFKKVATQIVKNYRRLQPHCHLTPPPRGTPVNIRIRLIFPETRVIGLHFYRRQYGSIFIRVAVVVSQKCANFRENCTYSSSRSSKVIDFGTNRKRICDFLLVIWSYLAPFLRHGNLLAENCLFFIPLSYSAPQLHMFPLEFRAEINREETRVVGLLCGETWKLHDPNFNRLWLIHPCDRVTDGQTDGRAIAYSALQHIMLSRGKNCRGSLERWVRSPHTSARHLARLSVGHANRQNDPTRRYKHETGKHAIKYIDFTCNGH